MLVLQPGFNKIKTGFKIQLPQGHFGLIKARSGLS